MSRSNKKWCRCWNTSPIHWHAKLYLFIAVYQKKALERESRDIAKETLCCEMQKPCMSSEATTARTQVCWCWQQREQLQQCLTTGEQDNRLYFFGKFFAGLYPPCRPSLSVQGLIPCPRLKNYINSPKLTICGWIKSFFFFFQVPICVPNNK